MVHALSGQTPHVFVVPGRGDFVSGGNRFNGELLAALGAVSDRFSATDLAGAGSLLRESASGVFWIDTFYLSAFEALSGSAPAGAELALLVHFLPSLSPCAPSTQLLLSREERFAIDRASAFLATSQYMGGVLAGLGAAGAVYTVEPGLELAAPRSRRPERGIRAISVANLIQSKGVLDLLVSLASELRSGDAFALDVAGDATLDPLYGEECRKVATRGTLAGRVRILGATPHPVVLSLLQAANLFVSPSRGESYGMALAEARAAGLPIVARRGGNVAAHVSRGAGGRLCEDARQLARECVALCRHPAEHAHRLALAGSAVPPPRTWADAARELLAQLPP